MEQAAQTNARKNVMGWQMAGATPRVDPVGTWMPTPASELMPVRRPATPRPRPQARPVPVKATLPRLLPAVFAAAIVSSLIGGVAVARFPRDPAALSNAQTYPMNVAVTVQGGDSLWSIAQRYGNSDRYILDRVDEIASANEISTDASLLPGQQIWVPAHTAEERTHITSRRIVR